MPFKGKRPRCKCSHADSKHRPRFDDETGVPRERYECRAKGCPCKEFVFQGLGEKR